MKTRTCSVSSKYPRVDVFYDGILFRRAAIYGAGGIMGAVGRHAWLEILPRVHRMAAHGEMLRVYLADPDGKPDFFDAPAVRCTMLAVYAPGHAP